VGLWTVNICDTALFIDLLQLPPMQLLKSLFLIRTLQLEA